MVRRGILAAAAAIALAVPAWAQGPGPAGREGGPPFPRGGRFGGPVRDSVPAPTGTAKLSGRVVAAETGMPVRRAQVRIMSRDARTNREMTTDASGRYEFVSLAAGRYRLFVSKAGYVELEYGQARPFEAGKPLDVAEGQLLDKLDFSLPRGSVITGRITDEAGDPVTDVVVEAMRYQFANGERQLVNAGRRSMTDDLGQFRIYGLMPGDYLVRATARSANVPAAQAKEEPTGYPDSYYPGVVDVSQAQTVALALGQELGAVSFSLVPARLSRISGTVIGSDGRPLANAVIMLRPAGIAQATVRMNAVGGGQVRADGTFALANVPPGEYVLDVQQRPRNARSTEGLNIASLEFASMPLTVSGDIDNLTVVTTAGTSVRGRVIFQGSSGQKSAARGILVQATSPAQEPSLMAFARRALAAGRVNEDGTFELTGLVGPQLIRVQGLPTDWALKSVTLQGLDITDTPHDFRPGAAQPGELVVTLTDRISEVTGSVHDLRGQPVADYVAIVFAENAQLWGAQSRYVATSRPNQNGSFTIKGLPAGRYLAAALASLENGMQNDTQLLEQLRGTAHSVTLAEGQTLTVNLDITQR
jgi:protocatechuate 3,4-dioxygenase beta subunit